MNAVCACGCENHRQRQEVAVNWLAVVDVPSESTGDLPILVTAQSGLVTPEANPRTGMAFLHSGLEAALRCSVC